MGKLPFELIPGYDFPEGPKWTQKEISDWKRTSEKYYERLYDGVLKNTKQGLGITEETPTLAKAGAKIAGKVLRYFGNIANVVLDVSDPLTADGAYGGVERTTEILRNALKNKQGSTTNYTFPVLYEQGSPIYIEGATQYIYVPIPPARRLKALAVSPDTNGIATVPVPQISVEQAFSSRIWGEILHEPVSPRGYKYKVFDSSHFTDRLIKNSADAEKKLSGWLINGGSVAIENQCLVLIDYFDFDEGEKETDALCGLGQIQALYDSYYVRSKNARRPVVSMIPKEIKTERQKLKYTSYKTSGMHYRNTRGGLANKLSGTESYPLIVPKDIASGSDDKEMITNNAELGSYLIRMFSQVLGDFPIEIEVDDIDQTKSGNQTERIKIPNLAEGIAEILGSSINSNLYSQALLNLAFKSMMQTTKNTIGISVTQDYARACADYFGFEQKEVERKLDIPFNPNETQVSKALQSSEIKYESIELIDKKDLNDYLHDLLQAAAIVKGANFKKFNVGNLPKEVKSYLRSLMNENSANGDDNWRQFLQQVEVGFSDEPVINKDNPYNRNKDERPRVRDIGEVK